MTRFSLACAALVCWLGLAAPVAAQAPTFVAVPGNVLSSLDKGVPRGIFIQAVDAVLRQMGKTPSYLLIPTGVALKSLEDGKLDVGTAVVPLERDKDRVWFSAPVLTEYTVVAVLRNQGFPLARIGELYGRKIGARAGYQYPLLDRDKRLGIARYHSDGEMIRALLFGEVDAILISGTSEIHSLRTEGMISKFDILPVAVDRIRLVAAFSRKSFTEAEVKAFDREMEAFKLSPAWQGILNQNGFADLVHDWPLAERD